MYGVRPSIIAKVSTKIVEMVVSWSISGIISTVATYTNPPAIKPCVCLCMCKRERARVRARTALLRGNQNHTSKYVCKNTNSPTHTCKRAHVLYTATRCNTLQHAATHCTTVAYCGYTYIPACHGCSAISTRNTLQHTATHCNTLQHTTTHYLHAMDVLQFQPS